MKRRCLHPSHKYYDRYGGRGIKVCERWVNSYANFLSDMGRRPSKKHSLDRIDNNGDYELSNCRWTLCVIQIRNREISKKIDWQGKLITIGELAEKSKIPYKILFYRLRQGWDLEKALNTEYLPTSR